MSKFCPTCEDYQEIKTETIQETFNVRGKDVEVSVSRRICSSCGDKLGSEGQDQQILENKKIYSEKGLSNDNIIHISESSDGIWLSTLGGGVTRFKANNMEESRTYTTSDGLTSEYVYSTFTDSKNRTWISTFFA